MILLTVVALVISVWQMIENAMQGDIPFTIVFTALTLLNMNTLKNLLD